jgi:hypothetical protein
LEGVQGDFLQEVTGVLNCQGWEKDKEELPGGENSMVKVDEKFKQ